MIVLLVAGTIGLFIVRLFFVWAVRVPAAAMSNTIVPGDHLIVYKLIGDPRRGDVVTYQRKKGGEYYVARIIGMPGETIKVTGKTVTIDGRVLDEERVTAIEESLGYEPLKEISTEGSGPYRVYYTRQIRPDEDDIEDHEGEFGTGEPFRIPNDSYFIMGDNRDNSEDSRYVGAIPRNLIWGKPSVIYYSVAPRSQNERWDRVFKKVQ